MALLVLTVAVSGQDGGACDGYLATGAGDPGGNGCYVRKPGNPFVLDPQHDLYVYGGVWRVATPGKHVRYVAKAATADGPPLAAADWQCGTGPAPGYPNGINGSACPAPSWTTHLPTPPPTPPAPPGSSLYPVPTTASDQAVDCAVRVSAWQFAQHIQPLGGAHLPVFDALELATRCHQPRGNVTAAAPARFGAADELPGARHPADGRGGQPAFHVNALTGRDAYVGSVAAPFATIGQGVRACRTATTTGTGGCTVFLSDDAPFVLNDTLALGPRDAHLTIMPEPGSTSSPMITSSVRLGSRWTPKNVSATQNVWKTAIPAGLGSATVYIGGRRGVLARWPNVDDPATSQVPLGYAAPAGWLKPRSRPPAKVIPQPAARRPEDLTFPDWTWGRAAAGSPPTFLPAEGYWMAPSPKGGSTYNVPAGVIYSADDAGFSERAAVWRNASTGHVHAFHGEYWGNWVFEIASHDRPNRTLHFGAGGSQEARGAHTGGGFFVSNIQEELDHPWEYFIDESTSELLVFYDASPGTPPPGGAVAMATLEQLVSVTGTAAAPATNITLRGLTLTGSRPTYLSRPFKAPSGGDWSFANTAALVVEGAQQFTLDKCSLHELGGNGLLLRGWNRDVTVSNSSFDRLGDSGIVTCGNADLADLSKLDVPAGTRIVGNRFSNLGIEVKQAGGLYSALSANHTVQGNLFYNMPRAGININDGAHGGHQINSNLFFNLVRETGDHGAFNSWDREPYIQTWKQGERRPALSHIHGNFLVNTHFGIHSLDHDDGSNNFLDTSNVVAFAGMKNFLGFAKQTNGNLFVRPDFVGASWSPSGPRPGLPGVPLPRAYYFPFCARSLGNKPWKDLADTYIGNTCIMNTSGSLYEYGSCDPNHPGSTGAIPKASRNTFYVPGGRPSNASFRCGAKDLTLNQAQAVGYETDSVSRESAALSPDGVQRTIRQFLGF